MPTNPAKARILLKNHKAKVINNNPFVIQLLYKPINTNTQIIKVGIDDGAKYVGIALVQERSKKDDLVIFSGTIDVTNNIKSKMDSRRNFRRCRRNRLRYRKPRFDNKIRTKCIICGQNAFKGHNTCRKHKGIQNQKAIKSNYWLPPSIKAKKDCIIRVLDKLSKWIPFNKITIETGKFDLQKIINPDISTIEYQQGPRYGYDSVKAALIAEYGRRDQKTNKIIARCCYCDEEDIPLEIEHIKPKSRGGTDTWNNLTLACRECNERKNNKTPEEAGMKLIVKPKNFISTNIFRYASQTQQGKYYLYSQIKNKYNIEPDFTYGQYTNWQRKTFNIDKTHINDAIIIAITTYDSLNKPKLPIVNNKEYNVTLRKTKQRALFTATCYSPKDMCYQNGGERKRINSIYAAVNFKYTVRALNEINKACILDNKNKAKAIRTIEKIPNNAKLIIKKGDIVSAIVSNKKIKGVVSACMSNGTVKVNNNGKQIAISLKKIIKKQNGSNINFL